MIWLEGVPCAYEADRLIVIAHDRETGYYWRVNEACRNCRVVPESYVDFHGADRLDCNPPPLVAQEMERIE